MFRICENHIYSDISIYNKRVIPFKKNLLSKISSKHLIYTKRRVYYGRYISRSYLNSTSYNFHKVI